MTDKVVTVELTIRVEDNVDIPEAISVLATKPRSIILASYVQGVGVRPVAEITGVEVLRVY